MINLYIAGNEDFSNNGDATLQPISSTVHKVINGMWMLEMEIPYDAEGRYRKVDKGCMLRISDPTVSEASSTQIWRIYNYKRNTKTISIMAFPRAMESNYDAPISQLIVSSDVTGVNASAILNNVSNKYTVESNITRTGRSEWTNTNLTKAINGTDASSFVNVWGGEVVYDNLTIKILDGIGSDEDVHDVMYGKNINEISYEVDDSGLITRVYPLSTDGIRYNVDGKEYIDSQKIEDYPIVHSGFLTTPYKLIEDDANSITRTANKTADIKSRIRDKASQLSHTIWNTAVANGWKIDYMASIAKDIIANIQAMVTTDIVHADLVKVINSAVNDGMIWMSEQEDPEWVWEQVGTDAWKYGSSESGRYARNEWQYVDKMWRWFGDDYLWQQPRDDDTTWTWYESKTTHKLWYGTQDKYYLKGQYIYYTDPDTGEFTKYWLDGDGWYDSSKKDTSDYEWHQDDDVGGAWYFGTQDDDGKRDKYISGQWVFIEGTLYWFDDNGYYYGEKKDQPRYEWNQSGEAWWFGNAESKMYDAEWLASQWCKIDRQWYRFDADGYAEDIHTQALSMFHSGMSDLTTLVEVCRAECYELLFDLMEEWTDSQFQKGLDVPTVTINVDMIDLSKTVDYADYQNLERIHLGDTVRCVDYVHHIATIERVVELTYDLLRGYNTSVTIGVANSTVGSMLSGSTGGGTASNNAINVDFIEQSLALKQPTLEAGKNITLTDNLDGTMTIASDKLIRAGDNVSVTHNSDGSDTISAEGGALEYWIEENTKLYRKEIANVNNSHGWDCDSAFKWNEDGTHTAFIIADTGGSDKFSVGHDGGQTCYAIAKVNGGLCILALGSENQAQLEAIFAGRAQVYPLTYSGATFYYSSLGISATDYDSIVWEDSHPWIGTASGRHFPMISGEYTSVENAINALIEQSHLHTKVIYYTGLSIDNEVVWGGVQHGIGDLSSVTPIQMQFYVTKDGVVEATDYKVNGTSIEQIYQKILRAGENITIGEDGKTISAKDTTYIAGANVNINGQNVISATDTNAVADMTDVTIDSETLADGQTLKWNATTEKWENSSGGGSANEIVGISESEYEQLPDTKLTDNLLYLTHNFEDIFDGADTIAMVGVVGVTYEDSSVSMNRGTLSGYEYSAGHEGFCIALQNLTVGESYNIEFDFQFTSAQFFGAGSYRVGYKISDTLISNYDNYTSWDDNIPRDLDKHHHSKTFSATATTMYLAFELDGCSDSASNYFTISDLYVIQGENVETKAHYNGLDYGNNGGGSNVEPNPSGTPTDTLNTIGIDGTIYEIAGSGGGGGFRKTVLYTATEFAQTINLSDDITNYDFIALHAETTAGGNHWEKSELYYVPSLAINDRIGFADDGSYSWYIITDSDTIEFSSSGGNRYYIKSVVGLKSGSGGESAPFKVINGQLCIKYKKEVTS